MTDLISDDQLSKALNYLSNTDESCARAKALLEGLQEQTKTVRGILFLQLPDMTVAEKEARVCANDVYKEHLGKIQEANVDFEIQRNKRNTAGVVVECWRTLQSNKRAGMI